MSEIILSQDAQKTMSSREIATLCDKQHGHVCRDIEKLNQTYLGMGLSIIGEGYYTHPSTGNQQHRQFLLTKDQCIDLVTGYNAELRIKINRRWVELEAQLSQLSQPSYMIEDPIKRAERWIEEERQKQVVIHQLELAAPKVAFVEKYIAGNGNKTFRQVAKLLNANERRFRDFLEKKGIMYKLNGEWTAYQNHIDARRFHNNTGISESGHTFARSLFTPKGVEWVAGEWAKFNLKGEWL